MSIASSKNNHKALLSALGNGPVVLTAHNELQRLADSTYPFVQESSFFWLTCINEADWQAIITQSEFILVAPERDETKVLFEGGLSREDALTLSGASKVISNNEADSVLSKLADDYTTVYTIGPDPHAKYYSFIENPALKKLHKRLSTIFKKVEDCRPQLSALRAHKSTKEVTAIQEAVDVSIRGFEAVKNQLKTLTYEYELEAILNSEFRRSGAGGHAYDPIVAAGKNACTLHYYHNNDPLPENGLVLIDAGAVVDGFAADITRTYAIGTPTERQIQIHKAVETAHYRIIELIKPGVLFETYRNMVEEIIKDALQEVDLLKSRSDQETFQKYFPHAVSHGLGLDVHESLGGGKEFQPGMVLTVEPGIYIPEEGIGVRIEDDILVTETGNRNLSAALPTAL